MFQDFLNDLRVLNTSDDLYLAPALLTLLYVYGGRVTLLPKLYRDLTFKGKPQLRLPF